MSETMIPGLHAPIDPKEWNLTLWQDHATAMISSEPAEEHTSSIYSAEGTEQLFEVDLDSFWGVAMKRFLEATGKEADEDDVERALEPIAQATAAKLVLAYQCHDELVEALADLLYDLEVRSGPSKLVDCGQGVYIQSKRALAKARGEEAPHA